MTSANSLGKATRENGKKKDRNKTGLLHTLFGSQEALAYLNFHQSCHSSPTQLYNNVHLTENLQEEKKIWDPHFP